MFCRKCGVQIPDDSAFCSKCGAAQRPGASPVPSAPAAVGPEEELWRGRPSLKVFAPWWALWFLGLVVLGVIHFAWIPKSHRGADGLMILYAVILGVPALWIFWSYLVDRFTIRYRLTTQRIFKEVGLIRRNVNEVELIRVDDVSVSQGILQRVFNVGKVTVISTDSTDPRLEIDGIENPLQVKEQIRTHMKKSRSGSTLNIQNL